MMQLIICKAQQLSKKISFVCCALSFLPLGMGAGRSSHGSSGVLCW
jgi:hypothetical protein